MRKGYGKGFGMGYKNLMPMDSHIHSLSAKGVKTAKGKMISLNAINHQEAKSIVNKLQKQGKWNQFKANARKRIQELRNKGHSLSEAIHKWREEHPVTEGLAIGSGVALGLIALGLPVGAVALTVGVGIGASEVLK